MSVEGEEEVELEIPITFDRRGDVAHPGFIFDTADIVEKDLWLDLGYVEYSLARGGLIFRGSC
ncbi:hypothetical protein C8J98_104287 [Luteibacter sp. OK325]|nr:hypothetical protein C8J98_104287 [Luteibacter sp. OK325]